jgi:hypothetical protein
VNSSDRTQLIAGAKQTALPAARCVAAGVRLDHLLNGKSWHELAALLTVALEAVDHQKLNALVQLPGDEGLTPEALREAMLRRAHAEVWRLRGAGEEIPLKLGLLENEYQAMHRRQPKPEPQQGEEAA